MEKKTAEQPKPKGGVKFAESKGPLGADAEGLQGNAATKESVVLEPEECKKRVLDIYNEVDSQFKRCTKNDPEVKRKDTARALSKILDKLKTALTYLNQQNSEFKEKNYYLTYNGTIYIFEVCQALRKSVYSVLTLQHLAYSVLSMETNLNLLGVKFLDWRVKLYIEIAHVYDQAESYKASAKTIDTAIQKVNELKEIEENDAPVPEHVNNILENNLRILRALEIKYKLHTGALNPDAWKKKMEDYFKKDIDGRNLAIIESLNLNYKKHSNIVAHAGTAFPWKEQILTFSYDMLKDDMNVVSKALSQLDEKMAMSMKLREDHELEPHARTELTAKIRDFDNNMILERTWKKASQNVPLELHIELLKHAYDLKSKLYGELLQTALVRCNHRRVEVPYIADIKVQEDSIPHPNIPNGYEKVAIDINEAHLRTELAQLRVSIVKEIAKQQEEKRQEKIADNRHGPGRRNQAENEVPREKPPHPSTIEVDPANVNHTYIYLLIKRSYSPENAIYGVDVVMANEEEGPVEMKAQGWRTIKIPINQYTGVRETTKMVPYLCLKHSRSSLRDEEEKKSLIVDFLPVLGKSYLVRPKFGFEKLPVDLRQVPQQFYKLPNLDFVYFSYKADKMFYICEREVHVLQCLDEVEKSYKGNRVTNEDEETRAHLDANYDLSKLRTLATTIKQSLDGPLGDYFFEARKDFLVKFAFYIWKKYLVSSLHQIDIAYELRITEEIGSSEFNKYEALIETMEDVFIETLEAINIIMTRTEVIDVVWTTRLNIELCKLLEQKGEFRKAAQLLRFSHNKIIEFKDQLFARGVESKKDVFLPLTITCDNLKISQMVDEMKNKYYDWKTWLRKEVRSKRREKMGGKPLEDDEAQEEDYEFREIAHFYGRDDLKDSSYLESLNFDKAFTEYYSLVNALHTDILADLIRCEIKAGKYSQKMGNLKNTDKLTLTLKNPEGIENIPERLRAKMTIMRGNTAKQVHKNATILQTTLQNAGKLDPPKPKVEGYENDLIQEGNNNSYFNALLYMIMATNKSKFPEQRYLLNEAFKYIKQAEEEEKMHILNGVNNAVFLFSTLLDDGNAEKKANNFYPFNYLYNPEYIQPTDAPQKPVLISRSTNSITLKLPPFEPIIPENLLLANPNLKIVTSMALFGKVSQHGVSVSVTSTDLQNTGTRLQNGAIVTVGKLRMNEKYCFGAAAYDPREKVINNQIGVTGEDVATVLPLPLNLLYSYLALTAYQLDDFELSEQAAERAGMYFYEETGIKERILDYSDNPIYMYRIRSEAIKNYSINELRIAAENYIVLARCLQRRFAKQEAQDKSMSYISKQKNTLVVCNYLLLALELCSMTKSFIVGKRIVKELYNDVLPFLSYKTKSKFVFQILLRVQLLISQIPKEVWDSNLRYCSIKVTYEILKMTLQFNEIRLSKLVLYHDSRLPHKKWFIVSKTIMVEESALLEAKDSKDDKKGSKKDSKKGKGKPEEQPADTNEPPKLVPKLVREIAEKMTLQDNIEEFLLSLGEEYYDSVINFIDFWKEQLELFKPYIDNGIEIIEQKKVDLSIKFDFWDLLRDHTQAFLKLQQNYKGSPNYMEFVCKYLRKGFEKRIEPKDLIEQMKQVTETSSEPIQLLNQIRDLKLRAIEGDIGWNPNLLDELVLEREINKVGEDLAIEIYTEYWKCFKELQEKGMQDKQFFYDVKWLAEYNFLRATLHYIQLYGGIKDEIENRYEVFFDIRQMDLESLKITQEEDPDQSFAMIDSNRIKELTLIMKYLCNAAVYGLAGNLTYLVQNIAKTAFNIFKVEMLTPSDHKGTEFYKHLVLLSENLVSLLELNKEKVRLTRGDNSVFFDLALSRQAWVQAQKKGDKEGNSKQYLLDTTLTTDFWFSKENLDITSIANITAYCIQTLTVENKLRVLVEDSKHFCNMTQHFFSLEVLPFTVHAQRRLYEQAKEQTLAKIKQLEDRTKEFEDWKVTNKKRRTRQAMLTGEIPPEQIAYEKDAEELNRQIKIHKQKENFLNNEKIRSEEVLSQIKRDMNQVLDGLNQTRKLLAEYGPGMKKAEIEEKAVQPDETIGKRNRYLSQTLITKYSFIIESLKKKQEITALIQALHELGNINFSTENVLGAVENWNESLDNIFQRIDTIKSFREVLGNYKNKNLGFILGVQKCLIGGILLYKLSNLCYHNSLHLQRECALMAFEMIFAIFKISLPHHFIPIDYGLYRVKEIIEKEDVFSNKYVLNPAEVIMACNYNALYLMDVDKHVHALPILGLMEYLATDVVMSAYYSTKAKILKSICLSSVGYINEAYIILSKVAKERDLPMGFFRTSEYSKKEYGYNFSPDIVGYANQYSPYDDRNNTAIENIMKLEIAPNFKFKYGFINANLFYLAKAALIFTIYDVENYEKVDLNDRRFNKLAEAESILRSTLKRLSFEEGLYSLSEEYRNLETKAQLQDTEAKTKADAMKATMVEFMTNAGVEAAEHEPHLKHKEASLRYSEAREETIAMILRIRYLLTSINNAMNFTTRSYYILKQAIVNLKLYAEDQKDVEKGDEPGNAPLEFKATDDKGGKADNKPKKEAKKETKDVKKDTKKDSKKPGQGAGPDDEKRQAELEKRKQEEEMAALRHLAEERRGRNIFNGFWWIKLRTDFCHILCKENKLEECLALIDLFKKDCNDLKDTFFIRTLYEIEAKVLLKQGKIDESLEKYQKVIQHAKTYHHDDVGFGKILGDYADVLFQKGKTEEAEAYYKTARTVFSNLLHEVRYEFYPQNINRLALDEEVKISEMLQLPADVENNIMKSDKFKAKKEEKKGGSKEDKSKKADPKGKGKAEAVERIDEMNINPLAPLAELDFLKENKYNFLAAEEKQVSSQLPFVYSLKHYEYYVKATLNQVRCNLYREDTKWDQHLVDRALDDVNTIIQNIYQTPISMKYLFNFLFGKAFRRKFVEDLLKIHREYEEKYVKQKVKKYRKLHTRVPFRDLLRNIYMIDIPGFSEALKETLLLYLDKSKEYLKKAADLLKSECLFFENGIKVEEVFIELSQVCLYKREYRPRPNFKYYFSEDLESVAKDRGIEDIKDFNKHLEELVEGDKKQCDDLEWEAFSYLLYSIQASQAKVQLQDNFSTIGLSNLLVPEKIPTDIYNMIIESDYQQKKTYESKLFDEAKRKTIVSSIDVLVFLNRLARESSILSFSGMNNQKIISRLHRYTSVHLSTYAHKCVLQKTEVQLRESKALPLPEGTIIAKLSQNPKTKEHKLTYMFGPLNKDKLQASASAEEINKIIINPENDVLFGILYFEDLELSQLLQEAYDLKNRMEASDKRSEEAKERDYKHHRFDFQTLITKFGIKFKEKDTSSKDQSKITNAPAAEADIDPTEFLDKYQVFVPDLTKESINVIIGLFDGIGLNTVNFNYLALFRNFHKMKYR